MLTPNNHRKVIVWFLLAGIFLGISACTGESGLVYRTWIDYPVQGESFSTGSAIPITFHFSGSTPISDVLVSVNGELIHQGPPPEANDPVIGMTREWVPDQPGDYIIEVSVQNDQGEMVSSAQVDISILEELQPVQPDLAVSDLFLEGTDRISCEFTNQGGAVLPAGKDVWIDIIIGPALADIPPIAHSNIGVGDSLEAGAVRIFTTAPLSPAPGWPQQVSCMIDAEDQVGEPDETNNKLVMNLGVGLPTYTSTPSQSPPPTSQPPPTTQAPPTTQPSPPPTTRVPTDTPVPDTKAPKIQNVNHTPSRIAELPCGQNTVTVSAKVTDPSGVSQVKLFYRAAKGGTTGSWQNKTMSPVGGSTFQVDIGPSDLSASISPYAGLNMEYYVKAWDTKNNNGQSPTGSLPLDYCVQ